MVHCHTVHLPLGALLSPCTMCGTGMHRDLKPENILLDKSGVAKVYCSDS